jgi:hypothetical protein
LPAGAVWKINEPRGKAGNFSLAHHSWVSLSLLLRFVIILGEQVWPFLIKPLNAGSRINNLNEEGFVHRVKIRLLISKMKWIK